MRYWTLWVGGAFLCILLDARPLAAEEASPQEPLSAQESLEIPKTLAHVTDSYWLPSSTPPDFILIQDVHRHPQVQAQIASLIVHGYEHWGVKKVFLEGAFTPLDMSVFHRVPNKTRDILMQRLVKDGDLSGPELAAVMIMEREWRNPPVSPFQLFGLEEPALYRKNVLAYQAVLAKRERALDELVPLRRLQESMHFAEPNPLNEQLNRVEALLRLKLTPAEYELYRQAQAAVPSTPALDPAIRAAEDFYRLAQERSQVFLHQASRRVPASTAPRILVVGGFHTAYMAAVLRQQGRSYVVLSPEVAPSMEDPVYEKRLQETATVLTEALVPIRH